MKMLQIVGVSVDEVEVPLCIDEIELPKGRGALITDHIVCISIRSERLFSMRQSIHPKQLIIY